MVPSAYPRAAVPPNHYGWVCTALAVQPYALGICLEVTSYAHLAKEISYSAGAPEYWLLVFDIFGQKIFESVLEAGRF